MFDSNINQNTVTIYVWKNSEFFGATGHVALRTYQHGRNNQGIYVSFWPHGRNDADYMTDAFMVEYHEGGCFRTHKYDLLKVNGGQPPDYVLHLKDLDTEKIAHEFEKILAERIVFSLYSSMAMFDFFSKTANCSQIIYRILRAAGLPHEIVRLGCFLSGLTLYAIASPVLAVSGYKLYNSAIGNDEMAVTLKEFSSSFFSITRTNNLFIKSLGAIQGYLTNSFPLLLLAPLFIYLGEKLCHRSGYKASRTVALSGSIVSIIMAITACRCLDAHFRHIHSYGEPPSLEVLRGVFIKSYEMARLLGESFFLQSNTMYWNACLLMSLSTIERALVNSPSKTLAIVSLSSNLDESTSVDSDIISAVHNTSTFFRLRSKLSKAAYNIWQENKITCIFLAATIYFYRGVFKGPREIVLGPIQEHLEFVRSRIA